MTNRSEAKPVQVVDLATHPRAETTNGLTNIRQV